MIILSKYLSNFMLEISKETLIIAIVFTFFITVLFSSLVLIIFPKIGLMDNPKLYGYKREPIPLPGGVAPVLAFLISIILFFPPSEKKIGLLLGLFLIFSISFIDDIKPISPALRLMIHIIAGIIVVINGVKIEFLGNPFGESINLNSIFLFLPELITIAWIIALTNIMNWSDGIAGLSMINAFFISMFIGFLSITDIVNQPNIALLSFCISAASLGFLIFNIHPPKILLGDSGAMSIGFLLAIITVFNGGKIFTAFIVALLPILDSFYVVIKRIINKKNPLKGKDGYHLHDKLIRIGWNERKIILLFCSFSFFSGWLSLQMGSLGKLITIVIATIIFIIFSYFVDKKLK